MTLTDEYSADLKNPRNFFPFTEKSRSIETTFSSEKPVVLRDLGSASSTGASPTVRLYGLLRLTSKDDDMRTRCLPSTREKQRTSERRHDHAGGRALIKHFINVGWLRLPPWSPRIRLEDRAPIRRSWRRPHLTRLLDLADGGEHPPRCSPRGQH